jgi:hypothetical protein
MLAEIGEVLGDLSLRDIENFLKMADAKRTTCKQMDDPQPRGIAETLVNLNQFHGRNMAFPIYSSTHIFLLAHIIQYELPAGRRTPAILQDRGEKPLLRLHKRAKSYSLEFSLEGCAQFVLQRLGGAIDASLHCLCADAEKFSALLLRAAFNSK